MTRVRLLLRGRNICVPGLLCACILFGQQSIQFQGSVPAGSGSSTPLALTLNDAIRRGLETNLGLLTRANTSGEARAQRVRALSALLPQVTGTLGETAEQLNLKTLGINFHFPPIPGFTGIPTIVGPFEYTAVQANISAKVFDWNALKTLSSARANQEAARLAVEDARDLVVEGVVNGYLEIIASASRVASIQAQVNTAEAIYNRAVDQHQAGTSRPSMYCGRKWNSRPSSSGCWRNRTSSTKTS